MKIHHHKTVLVLGYSPDETKLHSLLRSKGCKVLHESRFIKNQQQYDLVVSFGYRRILSGEEITSLNCPIINLHMSYLPFNRGAHPNFWSFYDQTPSGVSIHLIDEGIDTGPTLWQTRMDLDPKLATFRDTYWTLFRCLEDLFEDKLDLILNSNWAPFHSNITGTFHSLKDLPLEFRGWDQNIESEIARLKEIRGAKQV